MGTVDKKTDSWRTVTERPALVLAGLIGVAVLVSLASKLASGEVELSYLIVLIWRGVVNGLVIGLAGVGLSMTYSILNFANFAHGDYITSGAFAGWAASWVVAGIGLAEMDIGSLVMVGAGGNIFAPQLGTSVVQNPLAIVIGLVVAGAFAIVLSLVLDRLVYKPMRGQDGIALLIASIGVAFILRYMVVFVWGTGSRAVATSSGGFQLGIGGVVVNFGYHEIVLVVCSAILMIGVHALLQRTKLGKAMRAMSDNKDLARVTGIPTEQVIRWTWIIGAGMAGVAGYLLILESGTIAYNRGWILLLLIFAAVILGGIGSIYGAIAGGLIIGLTDTLSLLWIPSDFTKAAAFGLMILILLFRPSGLFAGRTTA